MGRLVIPMLICFTLVASAVVVAEPPAKSAAAEPATKRFIDRGDYVEDTQTGLLWQKDGAASGKKNYYQAQEYAAKLKLGKMTGWRVPTADELKAIFPADGAPFVNTRYNPEMYNPKVKGEWVNYWTADLDTRLPDYAYVYHWYAKGGANNCTASKNFVFVRCVHDPVKRK
jgi:hypothetical protein